MTSFDLLARVVRQHGLGYTTSDEYLNKLLDLFINDPELEVAEAEKVAAIIPEAQRRTLISKMDEGIAIGLQRGWTHHARLRAWAAVLKSVWDKDNAKSCGGAAEQ